MRSMLRRACLRAPLLALLALAGCGDDGGGAVGPNPSLNGHWTGTAKFHTVRFEATFDQVGTEVTGIGSFTSPLGGDDFTATGTNLGGEVRLTLVAPTIGTATYNGHFVARDRVTGRLDAPGYDDMELTIDRD